MDEPQDAGKVVAVLSRAKQLSVFVATAAVVLTASAIYYPYTRAAVQQHNLALARDHIEALLPILKANRNFTNVRLDVSPADAGSILVTGTVLNDEHLEQLRRNVVASNPPVVVRWNVYSSTSTTQPSAL